VTATKAPTYPKTIKVTALKRALLEERMWGYAMFADLMKSVLKFQRAGD